MTDASKISTLMEDARECEQRDAMKEKTASPQEQPQSSPENKVNGASSTASVATSEDSSTSKRPEEAEQQLASAAASRKEAEADAVVVNHALALTQLARQLEYYFSSQNLAKDTYVQTLRKLNSGCVPVAILANFCKVKLLLSSMMMILEEEDRVHAVLQASTEHSEGRLRVVSIDTGSGKIVTDDARSGANTILAIGTHDNEPLTIATATTSISSSPTAAVATVLPSSPLGATNTLILRDVIPQVTVQDIHTLFTFEGCPSVVSIRQDVGNCWFVRLDTEDRVVMAQTMMHVQGQTLAGYPVHARLKASATLTVPIDTAPPMPASGWVPNASEGAIAGKSKLSRKKKSRGRKNKKKSNVTDSSEKKDAKDAKDNTSIDRNNNKIASTATISNSPSDIPPSLDEDNFPNLQDKKVEWENMSEQDSSSKSDNPDEDKYREDDDDEEEGDEGEGVNEGEEQRRSSSSKATFSSDGASTATTTSSSTESFPKKTLLFPAVGAYAAALMAPPCPKQLHSGATAMSATDKPQEHKEKPSDSKAVKGGVGNVDEIAAAAASGGPPPMVVQQPTWGQGRSFADILRKD